MISNLNSFPWVAKRGHVDGGRLTWKSLGIFHLNFFFFFFGTTSGNLEINKMKQTSRQEAMPRRGNQLTIAQSGPGSTPPPPLLACLTNAWHLIWQIYIRACALRPHRVLLASGRQSCCRCKSKALSLRTIAEEGGGRARKTLQWRWQSFGLEKREKKKSPGICLCTGGWGAYILCLIKTGNALKLLKKYLGSISGRVLALGKSLSRRHCRCAPQDKVCLPLCLPPASQDKLQVRMINDCK